MTRTKSDTAKIPPPPPSPKELAALQEFAEQGGRFSWFLGKCLMVVALVAIVAPIGVFLLHRSDVRDVELELAKSEARLQARIDDKSADRITFSQVVALLADHIEREHASD